MDTQTTIKCSKIQTNGGRKRVLEINGTTHSDVYSESKQLVQPTHFTCIKITDSMIKENFSKLKVSSIHLIWFIEFRLFSICNFTGEHISHWCHYRWAEIGFYEIGKIAYNIRCNDITKWWELCSCQTAAVRLPWENFRVSHRSIRDYLQDFSTNTWYTSIDRSKMNTEKLNSK